MFPKNYAAKESESRANDIADTAGKFNSNVPNLKIFSIADVGVATGGFSIENKLGEGGYGPVYKVNFYNKHVTGRFKTIKRAANHECMLNLLGSIARWTRNSCEETIKSFNSRI